MKLGKTVTILVLKGVFLCECPYTVCMCSLALVGELDLLWAWVMSSSRVCWQLLPWEVVGLETKGLEPGPGWAGVSLISGQLHWSWDQVTSCCSRSPEGQVHAGSIPFKYVLSPFPAPEPLSQRVAVLEQEVLELALGIGLGVGCGIQDHFWCTAYVSFSNACPCSIHRLGSILGLGWHHPSQLSNPLGHSSPCPSVELYNEVPAQAGAHTGAVVGNQPEFCAVSICFFCLVSGVSMCVHALHKWSLGFLLPSC